ncbi:hypothetical protein PQ462_01985 [Flavobacterium sp. KACC 22758]|uniref:hypothetical protein n=1 Tax=Flavobacterium sp. KACC 22758 TaxID=3025667 RepID=UPI0023664DEB|nr:hypothetical protein [Flavobacterium sp. KACC 22758]WDF60147.1 hypothetical protein PQ462_01985 [Flavobacterium sp. KACC 22758]
MTLLLISCHHKNEKITKTNTESKTFNSLNRIDTKKNEEDSVTIDTTLFSVYNLSKKTIAIVANLEYEGGDYSGNEFDKIFNQVDEKDSLYNVLIDDRNKVRNFEYYDTLGTFKLIRSNTLELEVKKIVDKSYYVYGTKGFSKITINKVVCALNTCRTNFIAFPIEKFDTAKNGKAIFCSKQLLKINYQKSYSDIERKIRQYEEKESKNYDYKDEIKPKVFANIGDYYFTYNDDFQWGMYPEKSKCDFPGRTIYIVKKDKPIKKFWVDGLDLFGIPCD